MTILQLRFGTLQVAGRAGVIFCPSIDFDCTGVGCGQCRVCGPVFVEASEIVNFLGLDGVGGPWKPFRNGLGTSAAPMGPELGGILG